MANRILPERLADETVLAMIDPIFLLLLIQSDPHFASPNQLQVSAVTTGSRTLDTGPSLSLHTAITILKFLSSWKEFDKLFRKILRSKFILSIDKRKTQN